jgi:hypothetical protein
VFYYREETKRVNIKSFREYSESTSRALREPLRSTANILKGYRGCDTHRDYLKRLEGGWVEGG